MKPAAVAGVYGKVLNGETLEFEVDVLSFNGNAPLPLALKFFFELRDRKYISIVDELFRLYSFQDIAKGIYRKYRMFPASWKNKLVEMKAAGDKKMAWFKEGWIPEESGKWFTENTTDIPNMLRQIPVSEKEEEFEKVIDEFIVNERVYFEKLDVLMNAYVSELRAIAGNKIGEYAKEALGIDKEKVNYMFGEVLSNVHKASEALLVLFDTLIMVPAMPETEGGRCSQLAKIIMDSGAGLLEAYQPYHARFFKVKSMFEKHKASAVSVPPAKRGGIKYFNFVELWREISESKPALRNQGVDSILILVVKRFPNYKLFLERILKEQKKVDHPAQVEIENALNHIMELTRKIDGAVKG